MVRRKRKTPRALSAAPADAAQQRTPPPPPKSDEDFRHGLRSYAEAERCGVAGYSAAGSSRQSHAIRTSSDDNHSSPSRYPPARAPGRYQGRHRPRGRRQVFWLVDCTAHISRRRQQRRHLIQGAHPPDAGRRDDEDRASPPRRKNRLPRRRGVPGTRASTHQVRRRCHHELTFLVTADQTSSSPP